MLMADVLSACNTITDLNIGRFNHHGLLEEAADIAAAISNHPSLTKLTISVPEVFDWSLSGLSMFQRDVDETDGTG